MSRQRRGPGPDSGGPRGIDVSRLSPLRLTAVVGASLGLALVSYALVTRVDPIARAMGSSTAKLTAFALSLLGTDVTANGPLLEAPPSLRFVVVPDCTPLAPIMLVAGAILAFPATWRVKLIGIIVGWLALSVLNLVRMMSLVYIGLYVPGWLDVAHVIVWQSAMVLAGILVWLFWLRRTLSARPA